MIDSPIGCESIGINVRIGDYFKYYFTRFIGNLNSAFDDFHRSDLEDYISRYRGSTILSLTDPLLVLNGFLVPIPRGMILSYGETLYALRDVLLHVDSDNLLGDLVGIEKLLADSTATYKAKSYSKKDYENDAKIISHLFSKVGLTNTSVESVIKSKEEAISDKDLLLSLVKDNYPNTLKINSALKALEATHSQIVLDDKQKVFISGLLMSIAYRLSIFSAAMEHVRYVEHGFVSCLNIIRNKSLRT